MLNRANVLNQSVIKATFPPMSNIHVINFGLDLIADAAITLQLSSRPILHTPTLAINSFIPDISIAPLQVHYYSELLPNTALIQCRN